LTDPATLHFLCRPDTYGSSVTVVEPIETQMSWVFLAGEQALKLKKSLHNPYLDFRTVAARCHACHEELRLNRRLAPSIYLGVESIWRDASGELQFGEGIELIDCVIRMRRLPEAAMLRTHLLQGSVNDKLLETIADRIAKFHLSLPALHPTTEVWCLALHHQIKLNESALLNQGQRLLQAAGQAAVPATVRELCRAQHDFLLKHADWIEQRITQGRMVEGHGDLRAEHMFVWDVNSDTVGAIDCLEFSRSLRELDCADEISFLALDCERLAGETVAQTLLQHYHKITGDYPPPALVHFYQSLRAAIRARLAMAHLANPGHRSRHEWTDRAHQWLQLAVKHAAHIGLTHPCMSSTSEPPA
jgi:aminoglycoside phosphotransferase family enzyme